MTWKEIFERGKSRHQHIYHPRWGTKELRSLFYPHRPAYRHTKLLRSGHHNHHMGDMNYIIHTLQQIQCVR